jgi:hypothetical protein
MSRARDDVQAQKEINDELLQKVSEQAQVKREIVAAEKVQAEFESRVARLADEATAAGFMCELLDSGVSFV